MPDVAEAGLPPLVARRVVLTRGLAAALVATLPACTGTPAPAGPGGSTGSGGSAPPSSPAPDPAVIGRALAGKQELIVRYAEVTAAHPGLREQLGPLAAEHEAHVQALRALVPASPPAPPAAAPAPATGGRRAALAALARRERELAESRIGDLLAAPPELARLLAAVGAAEAAHAALLADR